MDCSGVSCVEVVATIAEHFKVNILVFDDVKEKKVSGIIKGANLKQTLDCLSWLLSVEYVLRDGIYFFGSNTQSFLVLPSSGLDKIIEQVFKFVTVKQVNDKLVFGGTEKELSKVKGVYDELVTRNYCVLHLFAVEILTDSQLEAGFDIDKAVKYSFSWESLAAASYNPFQSLAMSLSASLKAEASDISVSSVIDTDIGLLSGNDLTFQVGEDFDRPVYNQSQYGERVVSSYSTQKTGLLLKISGYYDDKKDWYINFAVENSEAKSDVRKTLTTLNTVCRLSTQKPVSVLAKLSNTNIKNEYVKGIPFLSEIPYVGYVFRVTTERKVNKHIYFILQLKEFATLPPPAAASLPLTNIHKLLSK